MKYSALKLLRTTLCIFYFFIFFKFLKYKLKKAAGTSIWYNVTNNNKYSEIEFSEIDRQYSDRWITLSHNIGDIQMNDDMLSFRRLCWLLLTSIHNSVSFHTFEARHNIHTTIHVPIRGNTQSYMLVVILTTTAIIVRLIFEPVAVCVCWIVNKTQDTYFNDFISMTSLENVTCIL